MEQSITTKIVKRLFGEVTAVPFAFAAWAIVPVRLRCIIYNLFGAKISSKARIFPKTHIVGRHLELGDDSFINSGCHLDASDRLIIGKDVHLSPQVTILTITHEMSGPERRAGRTYTSPVVIEDGVWIGAGALILPGVTIGHGAMIASGAVVREDCEPDQLYAGVPAHSVRLLPLAIGLDPSEVTQR